MGDIGPAARVSPVLASFYSEGRMTLWADEDFMFATAEPFDEKAANNGNGTLAGFNLGSSIEVRNLAPPQNLWVNSP